MVARRPGHPGGEGAAFLIVTDDLALLEILGGRLRQWGAKVLHQDPDEGQAQLARRVDVILVDVRHRVEMMLGVLAAVRTATPFAETLLINSGNNVNGSMAGMRAGASDELTVPCDMETLHRKVRDAWCRSRARAAGKGRRSLFVLFEEAMSAAAFAQAGEFDTARSMLAPSGLGDEDGGEESAAAEIFNHGNARKR